MKSTLKSLIFLVLAVLCCTGASHAQIITTYAGIGGASNYGDGGQATNAAFGICYSIVADRSGNLYIADYSYSRIRKVSASGIITTYAGSGTGGGFSGDGGAATAAAIYNPTGLAFDTLGNLYIADQGNRRIRKVTPAGTISTFAGGGSSTSDGVSATAARVDCYRLQFDRNGNLFYSDVYSNKVRKITTSGLVYTVAGNGTGGHSGDGGAATSAMLNYPAGFAIDASGNLYIAEYAGNCVRKVSASGIISTFAGSTSSGFSGDGGAATAALLSGPMDVLLDTSGGMFVADQSNGRIRKITSSGAIFTAIGAGVGYTADGIAATAAKFTGMTSLCWDTSGNMYIAEGGNYFAVRKTRTDCGSAPTVASITGPAILNANDSLTLSETTTGGTWSSSDLSVATVSNTGVVHSVAGVGFATISYTVLNSCGMRTTSKHQVYDTSRAPVMVFLPDSLNFGCATLSSYPVLSFAILSGTASITGTITMPSNFYLKVSGTYYSTYSFSAGGGSIYEWEVAFHPGSLSAYSGNITFAVSGGPTLTLPVSGSGCSSVSCTPGSYRVVASNQTGKYCSIPIGTTVLSIVGGPPVSSYQWMIATDTSVWTGIAPATTYGVAGGDKNICGTYFPNNTWVRCRVGCGSVPFYTPPFLLSVDTGTAPTVSVITGPSTVAYGNTITLADSTSGGIWTSRPAATATVGSSGVVTGVTSGTATVTYTVLNNCGVYNRTKTVNVNNPLSCNTITTYAGTGAASYSGDGGAATAATFGGPNGIVFDKNNNLYIADIGNNRVRKITPGGIISTIAGNGTAGFSGDGGAATAAMLSGPVSLAFDTSGNLYIGDFYNARIRRVSTSGVITSVAGNGTTGYSGDGGAATAAKINSPRSIAFDAANNLYIGDQGNYRVRKVTTSTGIITTFAGTGTAGYYGDGGQATAALINYVYGITFDTTGNLYIADAANHIRKVNLSGVISTIAGDGIGYNTGDGGQATAAGFNSPRAPIFDRSGNLYFADASASTIRKIAPSGIINSIAGTGTSGFSGDNGAGNLAKLNTPSGLAFDTSGNLFISDLSNYRIRKLSPGFTVNPVYGPATVAIGSTITLNDSTAGGSWSSSNTSLATVNSSGVVTGVSVGSDTISYTVSNICGTFSAFQVVSVTAGASSCNIITTIAGTGTAGNTGNGGAATAAQIYHPYKTVIDAAGNLYFTEQNGYYIRKVNTSGVISVVAGTGTAGYTGDGGAATAARINGAAGLIMDAAGNIYFADLTSAVIRKINTSGIISTIAGTGSTAHTGDGGLATAAALNSPSDIAFDVSGNLYVVEFAGHCVRKINTSGVISTIAGTPGSSGFSGDGGPATAALLHSPNGIAIDMYTNIYIADGLNHRIRKIRFDGMMSTCVGSGTAGFSGDGYSAISAALNTPSGLMVDQANNLYINDFGNNRVRKVIIVNGTISTIAGNGSTTATDGVMATASGINGPTGVSIDSVGNVFVADNGNNRIRRFTPGLAPISAVSGYSAVAIGAAITLTVKPSGGNWNSTDVTVETVTSTGVVTGVSSGIAAVQYTISNSCGTSYSSKFVTVSPPTSCNILTTIAGNATYGYYGDGGPSTASIINYPISVAADASGNVYFGDYYNHRIRKINTSGIISTYAGTDSGGHTGDGGQATNARLVAPSWMKADGAGNLYFIDGDYIRKITPAGIISTIAGNGYPGFAGDGGPATASQLSYPNGIAIDGAGNLLISDGNNYRIRKINTSGTISTIAGTGSSSFGGDGGPASAASFLPNGICVDAPGNIYFCDNANHRIRKINTSGIVSTIAGTGGSGSYSDGVPATTFRLTQPSSIAIDTSGNLYVGSNYYVNIFKIAPSGIISFFAGSNPGYYGDGGPATAGAFQWPRDVATDNYGNVYVADATNSVVRKVSAGGTALAAISGPSTVCPGGNITLTDATSGGTWSSSASSIATVDGGGVVIGVSIGTAVITYAVSGTCGAGSVTKTITVSGLPYMASIVGAGSVCAGASTTFTDSTSGGTWSSSNSSIATVNAATGSVTGVSAGSATITYTFTSSCGSVTTTKVITVNAGATTPAIITGSTSICTGSSSTLADATTGGTWSSTSIGVATINASGVVTGVSPGTALISYTVTNSCGSAARTTTVVVTSGSTAGTISGASTVCVGATTTFTNTTTGGTWSSSNTSIATINSSGVITGVTAGTATITYTVTSGCGSATTTRPITVSPAASAGTISGAATVCTGTTITLTSSVSGGTWTSSAPSIASVSTGGIVLPLSAGSVTISYAVSGTCGSAIATKSVAVSSAPVVSSISGASTICAALTTTLTDTATGGTWSSSNSSVASVNSSGIVTGVAAGSATISYVKTNACGTASAAKGMTVGSLPSAGTLSGATAVCTGTTITLSSTATGGTWLSSNTAVATVVASTGVVRGVTAGTVTITYYVSSTCATAIATRSITVAASGSAGTITGVAAVCRGASATLTNSVSGGTWSSSNATIASISSTGVVTGVAAGSVTITYTTTSGCGSAFATKAFTVNALPYVSIISGPSSVCTGTTVTMTDSFSGGGWISSNTAAATITSSGVVTGISAGSTIITYFITNGCGTSVKTKALTVSTATAGSLAGPSSVAVGASIVLTTTVSGGTWTSSNTSIATVGTSGIVRGVATGTDTVVYTVSTSCGAATVSKAISVTAHRGFASVEEATGSIKVYPNPNNGSFTLELPEGTSNATVMITDISGKVIEVKSNSEETMYFDMRQYAAGAYLIRVSADGRMYSQKVIIE